MQTHLTRALIASMAGTALMLTAACSNNDDPLPPAQTSPTASTSPSESAPAWRAKYSDAQLKEYETALGRFTEYERRSEPVWAAGKATPSAKALFKEYFLDADTPYQTLRTYELVEVKTVGTPKVYWSRATSITDPKKAGQHGMKTAILQCVDFRTMHGTQHGQPTQQADKFQRPVRRVIHMYRLGASWLISAVDDRKGKPCDPGL